MTDSSYIAWAWSADSPASTISAAEDLGADHGHADGQDQQPGARRDERRQRDPGGDPATDHGGATRIADAADRGDVAGMLGVVAELVAQPADVDVDGPVEDLGLVVAVDGIEQLVAGQHPAVGLEEAGQEPELDPGQGDRHAVAGDLVAVEVDDQVGQREARAGAGVGVRRRRCGAGST